MNIADIKSVTDQLENHEMRILALEDKNKSTKVTNTITAGQQKQATITELIKGKKFKSGQEKIAVIVGYCEKILKLQPIREDDIKKNWVKGKFDGKYRSNIVERTSRDGLIRDIEDGTYDLSQSGESFFEDFIKNNDRQDKKRAE